MEGRAQRCAQSKWQRRGAARLPVCERLGAAEEGGGSAESGRAADTASRALILSTETRRPMQSEAATKPQSMNATSPAAREKPAGAAVLSETAVAYRTIERRPQSIELAARNARESLSHSRPDRTDRECGAAPAQRRTKPIRAPCR